MTYFYLLLTVSSTSAIGVVDEKLLIYVVYDPQIERDFRKVSCHVWIGTRDFVKVVIVFNFGVGGNARPKKIARHCFFALRYGFLNCVHA